MHYDAGADVEKLWRMSAAVVILLGSVQVNHIKSTLPVFLLLYTLQIQVLD